MFTWQNAKLLFSDGTPLFSKLTSSCSENSGLWRSSNASQFYNNIKNVLYKLNQSIDDKGNLLRQVTNRNKRIDPSGQNVKLTDDSKLDRRRPEKILDSVDPVILFNTALQHRMCLVCHRIEEYQKYRLTINSSATLQCQMLLLFTQQFC